MKPNHTSFLVGLVLGIGLASLIFIIFLGQGNSSFKTAGDVGFHSIDYSLVPNISSSMFSNSFHLGQSPKAVQVLSRNLSDKTDPRKAFMQRKPASSITNSKSTFLEIMNKLRQQSTPEIPQVPVEPPPPADPTTGTSTNSSSNVDPEDSGNVNRAKCRELYGTRKYLPDKFKQLPPLLYTFPGSGNTWTRLLIEYATGIYTGSVYNDGSLLKALPGEFTCDWRVSAIKAHPHTHTAIELINGHYHSDDGKCVKGGIHRFERAILLLRDPFDSIWSEYQRRETRSHVQGIPKNTFNWHRWQANAASLSHAYLDMWQHSHDVMLRHWKAPNVLFVKYEDLKNKATRVETLQKIVTFLRLRHLTAVEVKQLECAFELAENREAHRKIDPSMMTKKEAYVEDLACRMWQLFGGYASSQGYQVWKNLNCSEYAAIPKINVGPHGDYDHRWVRPGMKLLDFRGLPKQAMSNNQQGSPGKVFTQSQTPQTPQQREQTVRNQAIIPRDAHVDGSPDVVGNGKKEGQKKIKSELQKLMENAEFGGTFEEIAALRKRENGGNKPRNKLRKVPASQT